MADADVRPYVQHPAELYGYPVALFRGHTAYLWGWHSQAHSHSQISHSTCWLQGIVRSGLREGLPSRRCMAIHEAGRALTATLLRQQALQAGTTPKLEAVERVSIIPRGRCGPPQWWVVSVLSVGGWGGVSKPPRGRCSTSRCGWKMCQEWRGSWVCPLSPVACETDWDSCGSGAERGWGSG